MGYRGVIPRRLTMVLGGEGSARVHRVMEVIAEAVGVLRAKYMRQLKAHLRARREAAANAEGEQYPADAETELEPLPEDMEAPGGALPCLGPRCARAAAERGAEPGLVARGRVC